MLDPDPDEMNADPQTCENHTLIYSFLRYLVEELGHVLGCLLHQLVQQQELNSLNQEEHNLNKLFLQKEALSTRIYRTFQSALSLWA
jgi:hypothetical protein